MSTIIIASHRVTKGRDGKEYLSNLKVVGRIKKYGELGFDMFDETHWRKFLLEFKSSNGQPLITTTKEGEMVVYTVRLYGVNRQLLDQLGRDKPLKFIDLFPAPIYKDDGTIQRKNPVVHGDILLRRM